MKHLLSCAHAQMKAFKKIFIGLKPLQMFFITFAKNLILNTSTMKNILFTFLTISFLISCSKKDDPIPPEPLSKLPPETQTGANTFGCAINNQVFYPRNGTSALLSPGGRGLILWGDPSDTVGLGNYLELEIINNQDGKPCSRMVIHLQNLPQLKVGEYIWHSSNFNSSIDGLMQN